MNDKGNTAEPRGAGEGDEVNSRCFPRFARELEGCTGELLNFVEPGELTGEDPEGPGVEFVVQRVVFGQQSLSSSQNISAVISVSLIDD